MLLTINKFKMLKFHYLSIFFFSILTSLILPIQSLTFSIASGQTEDNYLDMNTSSSSESHSTNITSYQSMNKSNIPKPQVDVTIEGTLNDDKIKGGEGDDTIDGKEGYDTLHGGRGNDKINGEEGNDVINGEFGNDKLKGDEGSDRISGERDNDKIEGGVGDDKLYGGRGDDELDGGKGNDTLDGGEGSDKLNGGQGGDTFNCDQLDIVIDFNTDEGDKIIGCTAEDHAKPITTQNITSANK
jgi:Ca2+-binding RTX toxin-like protein